MSDDGAPVPPSADRPLRVAVVGAGPAGIYAAEALTRQDDVPVAVDLVDRLPSPFGLVRYGIAPDHPKMRAIRETLHRTLDDPLVRFVGNVEIGADITLDELRRHVDAVIYTYGAALDRHLGIDGRGPARQPGRHRVRRLVHRPSRRRPGPRRGGAGRRPVGGGGRRRQRGARRRAGPGPDRRRARDDGHAAARARRAGRHAGRGDHRAGPARSGAGHLHHPGAEGARRAGGGHGAGRPRRTSRWTPAPRSEPPPTGTSPATSRCCAGGPTTRRTRAGPG